MMRAVIAVVQVLQWGFILFICSLDNYFLDVLVMTVSFICHGMIISKRKHLKPILLCTAVATEMFYLGAKITVSFRYSQFFPVLIGLLLVYAVYRIGHRYEKKIEDVRKEAIRRDSDE
jgi:ABC-type iron transport system FetAB permease component